MNKWGLVNLQGFAQQRNHKENEKTAYRTGENICKWCDQ